MVRRSENLGDVLILGGGLAGLAAAHALSKAGRRIKVIEAEKSVGGLARTIEHNGFLFDLGGHRFITDDPTLETYIKDLLGEDCLTVSRSSKILLRNRYFDYPLRPLNALFGFGPITSSAIIAHYFLARLRAHIRSVPNISLQDWVVNQFGRKMFDIFFRDYSEKVWGMECQHIDMRWVEQRIQGLSLGAAIKKALSAKHTRQLPTLNHKFLYPRQGIGQIADKLALEIQEHNIISTDRRVMQVNHDGAQIKDVVTVGNNTRQLEKGHHFISTIPLPVLISALRPHPPAAVLAAASRLRSRDLVTVAVMTDRQRITRQTWIYVPEKEIPFGRIHEPTNWSRSMAPTGKSLLVVEFFCFRGDETWGSSDARLVESTIDHLSKLGFVRREEVIDYKVSRIANAYPLFEVGYSEHCETIYDYLSGFKNLYTAGRGGMFRYLNMDHTMAAGMQAAKDVIQHDLARSEAAISKEACA